MLNTVISQAEYERMVQENKKRIQNDFADSDDPAKHLTNDLVNHPNHYTFGSIEVIDYIRDKMTPDEFQGYCMGNILKYVSRHKHKNGVEDLKKAQVYLGWLIDSEEEPNESVCGYPG